MILDLHSNLKINGRFFPTGTYEDPPEVLLEEFEANPRLFTKVKPKSDKRKAKSETKSETKAKS